MTQSPKIITIAEASDQHPRHSEPAMIERRDGTLLLVWQEYLKSSKGTEDDAPNRIVSMTSRDGGHSWSDHQVLIENTPGDVNVYSPSFVRMEETGEILFFFFRYHVMEAGKKTVSSCYCRRSRDDGRTFADETLVWDHMPYGCASSVVKRLKSGRLVMPICRQMGEDWSPTDHWESTTIQSDDAGRTWRESRVWTDVPMRGVMEPHVEELKDGRLFMVSRTQLGSVFQSHSSDHGETWSKPQTTGRSAPESCPELVRVPKTGDLMLIWNNSQYDPKFSSHFGKRSPLTAGISNDDGESWKIIKNIVDDPKLCYSNPVAFFTSKGSCLVSYFEIPYTKEWTMNSPVCHLRSAVFDIDWLYS
jgi:sialidase-1